MRQLNDQDITAQPITTIHDYSHAGEGVGRYNGKPVFIPLAVRGETVRFEIVEEKKKFVRGRLLEIIEPAVYREDAECSTYQNCGGCQLLHLNYEDQLYFKQQRVISALRRIGGLKDALVEPILGMENPWHYRHTARFHIDQTAATERIGYYRLKSHTVEQVKNCPLLPTDFFQLLDAISGFLETLNALYRSLFARWCCAKDGQQVISWYSCLPMIFRKRMTRCVLTSWCPGSHI